MELELGDVKSRFDEKAGARGGRHLYSEQQQSVQLVAGGGTPGVF